MRVSMESVTKPWYFDVLVDGEKVYRCIAADEEEGWADILSETVANEWIPERVEGVVDIVFNGPEGTRPRAVG